MQIKRTQQQRSAATRAALLAAARPLFSQRGYADVGTPEIVAAAGVTRGALYHQFDGKLALFEAVFEQVEQEVTERIGRVLADSGATDAVGALRAGAEAWLDACAEPDVQRIILLEAPAALGWERWRELGMRYGMGLVEGALTAAMAAREIPDQPVRPLAHVLIGALDEAALYVARAPDPQQARTEVGAVLDTLLAGLVRPADSSSR
jgi:AcrR family transcriptional regulator